jgi:hypothetical protein
MLMKITRMAITFLLLPGLFACMSSNKIGPRVMGYTRIIVYDKSVNFPLKGNYNWYFEHRPIPEGLNTTFPGVDEMIEQALVKNFEEHGFILDDSAELSFYVSYQLIIDGMNDKELNKNYIFPDSPNRWRPAEFSYDKGTLLVDIVCAEDKCPRWRGSINANIFPELSDEQRKNRVSAAIKYLLKNFPPQ